VATGGVGTTSAAAALAVGVIAGPGALGATVPAVLMPFATAADKSTTQASMASLPAIAALLLLLFR